MAAERIGQAWADIWEAGVWAAGVWEPVDSFPPEEPPPAGTALTFRSTPRLFGPKRVATVT